MEKKTLCDLELNGKKALVRVDYNVPMDAGGILLTIPALPLRLILCVIFWSMALPLF